MEGKPDTVQVSEERPSPKFSDIDIVYKSKDNIKIEKEKSEEKSDYDKVEP